MQNRFMPISMMIWLGVAHTAIGLAIPTVMPAAGLENILLPE